MTARVRITGITLFALAALPLAASAGDTPAADVTTVAAAAAASTQAAPCAGDTALSLLQQRLLTKYDQDVNLLLQYVWTTRMIYQLDRRQTAEWAEGYRKAHTGC